MRCSSRRSFSDDGEWLDSNRSVSCGSLGSDQAARRVHAPRVQSRMDFSRPRDAPRRAARLSPDRGGRTARDALDAIHDCDDAVHRRLDVAALLHGAVPEMVAAQPAAPAERPAGSRLKHRRFFHDQHQLAGLHARDDHELPNPDGGPRLPQLRLGGGRDRPNDCGRARHRQA